MLNGIKNFLQIINDNWVTICVIISLAISAFQKIKGFIQKSDAEKIAIAKKQIRETMLKMVSDAEADYDEWNKSGKIKRSQVIKKIYEMYPVLAKAVDQEGLTAWIDAEIDASLGTLNTLIENIEE